MITLRDAGERLARLLAPRAFEDQARYHRIIDNLKRADHACGYDYPTVRVAVRWALQTERVEEQLDESIPTPTPDDLHEWLDEQTGGDEAPELAERVRRTLRDDQPPT